MTERSLSIGRIEQIRDLAQVQKVEGMLVQEWEIVQLCELALERLDQYGEQMPQEVLDKANAFKGRADDAGFLARAILKVSFGDDRE